MALRVERISVSIEPQFGGLPESVVGLRGEYFALHRRVTLWPDPVPSFSVTHLATGKKFPTCFESLKEAKRFLLWIEAQAPSSLATSMAIATWGTQDWEQMRELWRTYVAELY